MTKRLLTLPVLLVDCQTTANSPEKGHLLEVGWLPYRAADTSLPEEWAVHADLVRLPGDATLPTRVRRLTGIHPAGLDEAAPERVVWRRLSAAADEVARQRGFQRCPVVIHFARFERPFLQRLHQKCDFGTDFPFELICTHDISRRLYPELPRRGIRALAGFLGHSVPSARRCDGHVRATAVIWRHLVNRLAVEEQVASLDDLRRWLAERPVPEPLPRRYPMPRHQRNKAPDAPGIYRFIRSNGDLLYIGKARSLKKRLNSYFQPRRRHPEHVLEMLTQAAHIEVTVTASALEAALMESEAIKECSPPYNVALIEGDRAPIFVSRDFGRRSKSVDDVCCVGPLVSNDLVRLVHSVGCALGSGGSSAEITDGKAKAILAARLCPDETMLVRGIDCFREKHAVSIARLGLWQAMLRAGHDGWKERLSAEADRRLQADGEDLEADQESAADALSMEWTPEMVCRRIEGMLTHAGHQIRRARWLTRLTDAVVVWHTVGSGHGMHALILDGGCVVEYQSLAKIAALPVPSGHGRRWREKQGVLDLQAYDRLRVLTTELRRLIAEERLVCVRLGKKVHLMAGQVERLLRWV